MTDELLATMFPDVTPQTMQEWVDLAKAHKGIWLELSGEGNLGPTLFAERDGKMICCVISPLLDVTAAFQAAHTLKVGLNPDAMVLIVDARVCMSQPGQSLEEFERTRPKDLQKACEEDGAYESGLVMDCLVVHSVTADSLQMTTVPYVYDGNTLEWKNAATSEDAAAVSGRIPETMKTIMNLEPTIEEGMLELLAARAGLDDKVHQSYCKTRAAYQVLTALGYLVKDFGGYDKPWEEFVEESTLQPQN